MKRLKDTPLVKFFAPTTIPGLLKNYLLIAAICIIIARFTATTLWYANISLTHIIIEGSCIFIALLAFLVMWTTHSMCSTPMHVVGFGFLMVAIFDLLHTYFYPPLGLYPVGYFDLTIRFWILGRFTQAVVLFLAIHQFLQISLGKWLSLGVALVLPLLTAYLVISYPAIMPVLITENDLTPAKALMEYLIIAIFAITLVSTGRHLNENGVFSHKAIFMSLLLAISAEVCFIGLAGTSPFYNALGHMFKLSCYYYLYKGIFASTILYSYKTMAFANQHNTNVLNGLPLGLVTFDNHFVCTFANHEACKILQCTPQQLLGYKLDQIHRQLSCDNDSSAGIKNQFCARDTISNLLISIRNYSGEPIKIILNARYLETGAYMLLFSPAQKEQELQNLQLQTRTILDSVYDLVILTDKNNRIITCNKSFEKITGLSLNQVKDQNLAKLCRKLQVSSPYNLSKSLLNVDSPPLFEATLVSQVDQQKREVLINPSPVTNIDNQLIGYIICATDISALKNEQDKFLRQEKLALVGQMAAGIVHEIKNPLTTIKGFSQFLGTDDITPAEAKEFAKIIEETTDDINRVIIDFLTFARPRAADMKKVSAHRLIESVQPMLEGTLFMRGISLKYNIDKQEATIMADESQLKQVLLNLVKNAIEAVQQEKHPWVRISTGIKPQFNMMYIKIEDNGVGISEAEQKCLGTPFFTTKEKGTGLGLSICFQIIQEHGGNISVNSQPGQGTTFTILLPCIEIDKNPLSMSS